MRTSLTTLALAVTLAADVLAQAPDFDPTPREVLWDGSLGSDPLQALLPGHFTDNLRSDVVARCGDRLVLAHSLGSYRSFVPLEDASGSQPISVHDQARSPRDGPTGLDRLMTVGPDGLLAHDYDEGLGRFTTTTVAAGAWLGATHLAVGDMDGDGLDDVVGVDATGSSLLLLGDVHGVPVPTTSLALDATIHDLALLDYAGGTDREIALATDAGIEILEASGQVLLALQGPGVDQGLLLPFRQGGYAKQRLAYVLGVGGSQFLGCVGPGPELLVDLGGLNVLGGATGRLDGDEHDDLVLATDATTGAPLLTFRNRSQGGAPDGMPTFGLSSLDWLDYGDPEQAHGLTAVALSDLDADGDLDLQLADATGAPDPTLLTLWNAEIDAAARQATLTADSLPSSDSRFTHWQLSDIGELTLRWDAPRDPLPDATHLEVVVWHQPFGSTTLTPEALKGKRVPFDPWLEEPQPITVRWPQPGTDLSGAFVIEARLVRMGATNELEAVSTPATVRFVADPSSSFGTVVQHVEVLKAQALFPAGGGNNPEADPDSVTDRVDSGALPLPGPPEHGGGGPPKVVF